MTGESIWAMLKNIIGRGFDRVVRKPSLVQERETDPLNPDCMSYISCYKRAFFIKSDQLVSIGLKMSIEAPAPAERISVTFLRNVADHVQVKLDDL